MANRCTENQIVICNDKLIPRRVTRVRYFFKEQRIRGPIELFVKQVGNAHFCADEIVHKEVQTLYAMYVRHRGRLYLDAGLTVVAEL